MNHTRVIRDVSFNRFIRELISVVKEHPGGILVMDPYCGDDSRAEQSFMFSAKWEWNE